jgi:hypothetical protein
VLGFVLCSVCEAFVHPGILLSKPQLDFVKRQLADHKQPWTAAYDQLLQSKYANVNWKPKARKIIECGADNNPDKGCTEEVEDGLAAYSLSLLYALTGNVEYAKGAIRVLDAYSKKAVKHKGLNSPLMVAFVASVMTRAGELMRYLPPKGLWKAKSVKRFGQFLRKSYLPHIKKGRSYSGGNWEMAMSEAVMNIGIFLNSRSVYKQGIKLWKRRMRCYIYLKSDGALPRKPPTYSWWKKKDLLNHWFKQSEFVDGLAQETCRDFSHTMYALSSASNAAETAHIQGDDLFGLEQKRLVATHEFHAQYLSGAPAPSWLCNGKPNIDFREELFWGFEIVYNHYSIRKGIPMPNTEKLLQSKRPVKMSYMSLWETLTHGLSGKAQ